MKTIGFFNNKGGVGKTSLVYHIAWMAARLGLRVVAADLDPQANLTSMFLTEDELEVVWAKDPRSTIYGAVSPLFRGIGEIRDIPLQFANLDERDSQHHDIAENISLVLGDLELSRIEDDLATAWPDCGDGKERAFRVVSALARAIYGVGRRVQADVALVDVGPNLGALNRSALLACDYVVVPVGADLFSLQGLRNMGPMLRTWRGQWQERRSRSPDPSVSLPDGMMQPIGYVVMRHSVRAGDVARAYGKWVARMPEQYRQHILGESAPASDTMNDDPNFLAQLKDYRSLMPMAQEARKPIFLLRPADGAFGGHQTAVVNCFADFTSLTKKILQRCGIALPPAPHEAAPPSSPRIADPVP
jgi:chromosome partitioning protein